jgi:hypothetical protein
MLSPSRLWRIKTDLESWKLFYVRSHYVYNLTLHISNKVHYVIMLSDVLCGSWISNIYSVLDTFMVI